MAVFPIVLLTIFGWFHYGNFMLVSCIYLVRKGPAFWWTIDKQTNVSFWSHDLASAVKVSSRATQTTITNNLPASRWWSFLEPIVPFVECVPLNASLIVSSDCQNISRSFVFPPAYLNLFCFNRFFFFLSPICRLQRHLKSLNVWNLIIREWEIPLKSWRQRNKEREKSLNGVLRRWQYCGCHFRHNRCHRAAGCASLVDLQEVLLQALQR